MDHLEETAALTVSSDITLPNEPHDSLTRIANALELANHFTRLAYDPFARGDEIEKGYNNYGMTINYCTVCGMQLFYRDVSRDTLSIMAREFTGLAHDIGRIGK